MHEPVATLAFAEDKVVARTRGNGTVEVDDPDHFTGFQMHNKIVAGALQRLKIGPRDVETDDAGRIQVD